MFQDKGISALLGIVIIFSVAAVSGIVVLSQYSRIEGAEPAPIGLKTSIRIIGEESAEQQSTTTLQFSIQNISTDKDVYHSSEIMTLNVTLYSNANLEDVITKVTGINDRFIQDRILDIKKGENEMIFSYQLPRCNVCGGIAAGDYPLYCEINYSGVTVSDSITINIRQ